jgi:minor extracellular serine protease Vpr
MVILFNSRAVMIRLTLPSVCLFWGGIIFMLLMSGLFSPTLFAQQRISPSTQLLIHEWNAYSAVAGLAKQSGPMPSSMLRDYLIYPTEKGYYINALMEVEAQAGLMAKCQKIGIIVQTQAQSIWSVHVPVEVLNQVAQWPEIRFLSIDTPPQQLCDKEALMMANVDQVHQGLGGLPNAFNGEGVVVGIVDADYDLTHPIFAGSDKKPAISRVWSMGATGTPPAGFSYGAEWKTADEMLTAQTDKMPAWTNSHGIHVAGIAAARGNNNAERVGVAPKSDLVLVSYPSPYRWKVDSLLDRGPTSIRFGHSALLDAARYILDYAGSQSKPAVVNYSLGYPIGPRDGTDMLSKGLDNLTSAGKIIVASAGNSGDTTWHIRHTFQANDTVKSLSQFGNHEDQWLAIYDIWGSGDACFGLDFYLPDLSQRQAMRRTYCIAPNAPAVFDTVIYNRETLYVKIAGNHPSESTNQKGNIYCVIRVDTRRREPATRIGLWLTAPSGSQFDLWNTGFGDPQPFNDGSAWGDSALPKHSSGDNLMSVFDPANGRQVIAVGAYSNRNTWRSIDGVTLTPELLRAAPVGAIARFSSIGPSSDGRIKPDICAPGAYLLSGVSSFTYDFDNQQNRFFMPFREEFNGRQYPYAYYPGTSMAAPFTAGVIALMLQANPGLSVNQVRDILQQTAIQDTFTGTIPAGGNNQWGGGKVNALAAVQSALNTVSRDSDNWLSRAILLYPNPVSGGDDILYLQFGESLSVGTFSISIHDALGREVRKQSHLVNAANANAKIDVETLPTGLYSLTVRTKNEQAHFKWIKH